MPRFPSRETIVATQPVRGGAGKKMKQRKTADPDAIYIVGPVDQQPAPDHDGEQREVDPMQPAYCGRMFRLQPFHVHIFASEPRKVTVRIYMIYGAGVHFGFRRMQTLNRRKSRSPPFRRATRSSAGAG